MGRQYTIGLDFDCTLFDQMTPWLEAFEWRTGLRVNRKDIRNWDFSPAVPAELYPVMMECRTPDIYADALPEMGALSGVDDLLRMGHRLVVVTHDLQSHCKAKLASLQRWFPDLKEVVFAKDKWSVLPKMDLLVDDGAHNRPSILLTQPWNESTKLAQGQQRADDWYDVPCLVYGRGLYW